MRKPEVIIIGAGIAGLASAALLSKQARVTVYERSQVIGGKVRQTPLGNRAIDSGPTVFTLKPLFEEIFRACGERLKDWLDLTPLDTLATHSWPDKSQLILYADKECSFEAIRDFAGQENADGYLRFLDQARDTWELLYSSFIRQSKPSFPGLLMRCGPRRLSKINPYETYWDLLSRHFPDERLRQLFGRYATYCGSSPFHCPATLMLISHIEQAGVWSVSGGMQKIAEALAGIAMQNGAVFEFGCDVDRINVSRGRATGISVAGGMSRTADAIIFNGDTAALRNGHLGGDVSTAVPNTDQSTRTQSAMTWVFSARRQGTPLSLHNVFFSNDYRSEFDDTFKHGRLPQVPTTYVLAPDADDSDGNDNSERYFCLINAPADGDNKFYGEEETQRCLNTMINHLQDCGLRLSIEEDTILSTTPTDFAARFPQTGGALFGMAQHGWRASFQRPGIRTKKKGLYCAGGSVHPGAGVPMAALSGYMATKAIIQDYALT